LTGIISSFHKKIFLEKFEKRLTTTNFCGIIKSWKGGEANEQKEKKKTEKSGVQSKRFAKNLDAYSSNQSSECDYHLSQ
jgi:hypothetical protein